METEMINMLMSGGANLAFAVFLYQQNKDLQRRAYERELKQERKEEELRNRYDQVIRDLQTREELVRNELVNDVNNLDKRMSLLEQSITTLSTIISEIKASLIRVDNAT